MPQIQRHTSTVKNEGINGVLKNDTEELIKSFREDLRKVSSVSISASSLHPFIVDRVKLGCNPGPGAKLQN